MKRTHQPAKTEQPDQASLDRWEADGLSDFKLVDGRLVEVPRKPKTR